MKSSQGGETRQDSKPSPTWVAWIFDVSNRPLSGLLKSLPIIGLLLYGVLRFSLALFYNSFGFSPEEVGFGYAQTLVWSVYGIVAYALLFAIIDHGIPLIGVTIWRALDWVRGKDSWRIRDRIHDLGASPPAAVRALMLVFALIYLSSLVLTATWTGQRAANGDPVPYQLTRPFRAEAAIVHLLGAYADNNVVLQGQCVLYLGEADGIYALFDPASGAALRVPAGSVVIETDLGNVERVPADC